jgi:hypothetical protein
MAILIGWRVLGVVLAGGLVGLGRALLGG